MSRADELTVRVLDGEASAAERDELERLLEHEEGAQRAFLGLAEVEAALRATGRHPDVVGEVLARIRRERTDRVVRGVMRQIEATGPRPAASRAPRVRRLLHLWPLGVLLAASLAAAAVVGLRRAGRVPGRGHPPATAPERGPTPPPPPKPKRPPVSREGEGPGETPGAARAPVVPIAPAAGAPVVGARPVPGETTVASFDFESDESARLLLEGQLVSQPCPAGSHRCVLGSMSLYGPRTNTVTIERFKPPLFEYAPAQVLSFDYWLGAETTDVVVQLWVPSRNQNFGLTLHNALRETWARAEVPLADLLGYGGGDRLAPGDRIGNIDIMGGAVAGRPFYVDNVRVVLPPPGRPGSSAARMLP
jgi:hypothetical protein